MHDTSLTRLAGDEVLLVRSRAKGRGLRPEGERIARHVVVVVAVVVTVVVVVLGLAGSGRKVVVMLVVYGSGRNQCWQKRPCLWGSKVFLLPVFEYCA